MSYYDKNPIGRLVTRTASDIELISSIFSQGLFMILADLLKMSLVIIIMLVIDWQLSLIVFSVLPIIVYATKLFQKSIFNLQFNKKNGENAIFCSENTIFVNVARFARKHF